MSIADPPFTVISFHGGTNPGLLFRPPFVCLAVRCVQRTLCCGRKSKTPSDDQAVAELFYLREEGASNTGGIYSAPMRKVQLKSCGGVIGGWKESCKWNGVTNTCSQSTGTFFFCFFASCALNSSIAANRTLYKTHGDIPWQ